MHIPMPRLAYAYAVKLAESTFYQHVVCFCGGVRSALSKAKVCYTIVVRYIKLAQLYVVTILGYAICCHKHFGSSANMSP